MAHKRPNGRRPTTDHWQACCTEPRRSLRNCEKSRLLKRQVLSKLLTHFTRTYRRRSCSLSRLDYVGCHNFSAVCAVCARGCAPVHIQTSLLAVAAIIRARLGSAPGLRQPASGPLTADASWTRSVTHCSNSRSQWARLCVHAGRQAWPGWNLGPVRVRWAREPDRIGGGRDREVRAVLLVVRARA